MMGYKVKRWKVRKTKERERKTERKRKTDREKERQMIERGGNENRVKETAHKL